MVGKTLQKAPLIENGYPSPVTSRMLTLAEVGELSLDNPSWWPKMCEGVAENGLKALTKEAKKRGWSWGAVWGWIVADEKRYLDYQRALEAFTQVKYHETLDIADDAPETKVGVSKAALRIGTRKDFTSKVDRARWGEVKRTETSQVLVVDAGLLGSASELLTKIRSLPEKVINPEDAP